MANFDYDTIPPNWTLKYLCHALCVEQQALSLLFADIRDFFARHPDIISLRHKASKSQMAAEVQVLREKYESLFSTVPRYSKVDREIVEGCFKYIFNNTDSGRVKSKSETPVPQLTPVSLSPPQPSTRVDTVPTIALPERIPDDRLVIAFTREGSPEAPPYTSCVQDIVNLNPLRSEPSTIRIQDVTKAAMIQLLIEENIMQTEDDKIWQVQENGLLAQLTTDRRIVGFLRSRCLGGRHRASIIITPAAPMPPPPTNPLPPLPPPVDPKHPSRGPKRALSIRSHHSLDLRSEYSEHNPPPHSEDSDAPIRRKKRLRRRHVELDSEASDYPSSRDESAITREKKKEPSPRDEEIEAPGTDAAFIEDVIKNDEDTWQSMLDAQLNSPEIEHMATLENWQLTCRLIGWDATKTTSQPCIQLPALKEKLNQYQFFAVVLFHLWARNWQNGGFLADGMGLGKTLQALGVIVFENILHHNYRIVRRCQISNNSQMMNLHRKKDGTGECKGSPLFFVQCPCDLGSDLRKLFQPRPGFSLIFLPQAIIPVWRKEYAKFYDPDNTEIKLHFRIAHGKHGAQHSLTAKDHKQLRGKYPDEVITSMDGRLYQAVPPDIWQHKGTPQKNSHQYLVITTPQSYESHLYRPISYEYAWSAQADPPTSGPGSKTKVRYTTAYIPGVFPGWVVIDEFHLLKSLTKNAGPWEYILEIRKWAPKMPAVLAMSGTPVSVGPADIKGPLMCLTSDQDRSVIKDLDEIDKRFKELVEADTSKKNMTTLISKFGALYRSRTLRRTEDSKWFGEKILDLPPIRHKDMDVAFPVQYREALKTMTHTIANDIEHDVNQGSLKDKIHTFYKTITRQQLLASTIPWLVDFWGGSSGRTDERLLAASYPSDHLDNDRNWLPSNPFHEMGNLYTGGTSLPKFRELDKILAFAHRRDCKMLVFSQFIAVASFAQHYIQHHPQYPLPARLFSADLSESIKAQLVSGFQDERVDGPESAFVVQEASLRPRVLCGVQSALGTGLNLFAGNVCVFMEPYGQPAHTKQALKRLHRRGQTREVFVYRLTCADKKNGVLAERIILKRANARDMFAEGIFQSKVPDQFNGLNVDDDERNEDDFE